MKHTESTESSTFTKELELSEYGHSARLPMLVNHLDEYLMLSHLLILNLLPDSKYTASSLNLFHFFDNKHSFVKQTGIH